MADPPTATKPPLWLRLLPIVVLLILVGLAFATGAADRLTLASLRENRADLLEWVGARPLLSLLIFTGVYAATTALSLPTGLVLTLTGGFLFGTWIGGGAVVVGATLGGLVLFLAMRTAIGDSLAKRLGGRLAKIEQGLRDDAFSYLLLLRFLPLAPFWAVNLAAGLVRMRVSTFVVATFLGIIPGTLVYAGLGAGLGVLFEQGREPDASIIFEPRILLPLIGLAVISLAPVVWRLVKARRAA